MAEIIAEVDIRANTRPMEAGIDRALKKPRQLRGFNERSFTQPLGKIKGALGEFDKSLAASNARVLAFGASAGAIFVLNKALKETVVATVDVEKRLKSINAIAGASNRDLKKLGEGLFEIARKTESSFSQVADAAEEFARQGLGLEGTLKRTSAAMILARTAAMDVVEAANSITAALNSSNDALLDEITFINKLVAVDQKFAVSAEDLAQAIKRVGSSAFDAGLSMDQLVAAVTTAQQITARGGSVIGNSFKTIFTRIQRPRVIGALEEIGVQTKSANGEALAAIDILGNLSKTYDGLAQSQRSQIAELVGGVFQINVLKATLKDLNSQYSIYNNALKISQGATSEAVLRNEELNQTLAAGVNRMMVNLTQSGAGAGEMLFKPLLDNLVNGLNTALEAKIPGSGLAEGLLKGFGKALAGPGLVVGFIGLAKLTKVVGSQLIDALRTILGLNKAAKEQELIQQSVTALLETQPKLYAKIKSGAIGVEKAAKILGNVIDNNNAKLERQARLTGQIAAGLHGRGFAVHDPGGTHASSGSIMRRGQGPKPNFSAIDDAIARERAAGVPLSKIRVGRDPRLKSNSNPGGVGVYNTEDEPQGLSQGINRAIGSGINPKTHGFSPNFAGRGRLSKVMGGFGVGSFLLPAAGSAIGDAIGGKTGGAISGLSLGAGTGFAATSLIPGGKGKAIGVAIAALTSITSVFSALSSAGGDILSEFESLKEHTQKTTDGLASYAQLLGQLDSSLLDQNVTSKQIASMQSKLLLVMKDLPTEVQTQVAGIRDVNKLQDKIAEITQKQTQELGQVKLASEIFQKVSDTGFFSRLKTMELGKGSIFGALQGADAKTARATGVASQIFGQLDIERIAKGGGQLFSGGRSSTTGNLSSLGLDPRLIDALSNLNSESFGSISSALEKMANNLVRSKDLIEKATESRKEENAQLKPFREAARAAANELEKAKAVLMGAAGFQAGFSATERANRGSLMLAGARGGSRLGQRFLSEEGQANLGLGIAQATNRERFISASSGIVRSTRKKISGLNADADATKIADILAKSQQELITLRQKLEKNNQLAELQNSISRQEAQINKNLGLGGGVGSIKDPSQISKLISGVQTSAVQFSSGTNRGAGAVGLAQTFLAQGGDSGSGVLKALKGIAVKERAGEILDVNRRISGILGRVSPELGRGSLISRGQAFSAAEQQVSTLIKTEDVPRNIQKMTDLLGRLVSLQSSSQPIPGLEKAFQNALSNALVSAARVSVGRAQFGADLTQSALVGQEQRSRTSGLSFNAGGRIPPEAAFLESAMAKAGGFNPGSIRREGNLIYNSAEKVTRTPFGPIISPPPGSLAGFKHRQKLKGLNFAASGFIFEQLLARAKDSHLGSGVASKIFEARNISDKGIIKLAQKLGVIGANQGADFLTRSARGAGELAKKLPANAGPSASGLKAASSFDPRFAVNEAAENVAARKQILKETSQKGLSSASRQKLGKVTNLGKTPFQKSLELFKRANIFKATASSLGGMGKALGGGALSLGGNILGKIATGAGNPLTLLSSPITTALESEAAHLREGSNIEMLRSGELAQRDVSRTRLKMLRASAMEEGLSSSERRKRELLAQVGTARFAGDRETLEKSKAELFNLNARIGKKETFKEFQMRTGGIKPATRASSSDILAQGRAMGGFGGTSEVDFLKSQRGNFGGDSEFQGGFINAIARYNAGAIASRTGADPESLIPKITSQLEKTGTVDLGSFRNVRSTRDKVQKTPSEQAEGGTSTENLISALKELAAEMQKRSTQNQGVGSRESEVNVNVEFGGTVGTQGSGDDDEVKKVIGRISTQLKSEIDAIAQELGLTAVVRAVRGTD